jgi:hypothetical protein
MECGLLKAASEPDSLPQMAAVDTVNNLAHSSLALRKSGT